MKVVISSIDAKSARGLAFSLIDEGVAACVSLVPGVTSIYPWKGEVEVSEETLLVVKTSDTALPHLMERIAALHPYDVPEIVALDTVAAHPPYARWVAQAAAPRTVD